MGLKDGQKGLRGKDLEQSLVEYGKADPTQLEGTKGHLQLSTKNLWSPQLWAFNVERVNGKRCWAGLRRSLSSATNQWDSFGQLRVIPKGLF